MTSAKSIHTCILLALLEPHILELDRLACRPTKVLAMAPKPELSTLADEDEDSPDDTQGFQQMKDKVRTKKIILMDLRESRVKNRNTIYMPITNMPTETQVVADIFT